jgi:hypothetical protein
VSAPTTNAGKTNQAVPGRKFPFRFSAVEMLIALVLLLVITPLIQDLPQGQGIEAILLSIFYLFAVLAVGTRKRTMIFSLLLAVPAVLAKWLNHFRPDLIPAHVALAVGLIFLAFVIIHILRFVLRSRAVNSEVLCASIATYLSLGLLWALAYRLVAIVNPAAFAMNVAQPGQSSMSGFAAFYFSFVTLSTVGYGDITPVSSVARMLAVTESMTGTLYVAVLIARLVALYSTTNLPTKEQTPES